MKISQCTKKMTDASKAFLEYMKENQISVEGLTPDYNLVTSSLEGEKIFNGVLIGTYIEGKKFFQFPFHPENPAIKEEDKEFYLKLKLFGEKVNIPELTETNISFDPLSVVIAQASRRMSPPVIYRNLSGEIESCYSLDELVSIAAEFHNAKTFIALGYEGYKVYLAILDEFN